MPAQSGQCPNFGYCNLADSREIVTIQPGVEFRCPECNSTLRPVSEPGKPRGLLIGALGGVGLLLLLAVAFLFAHGHGHDTGSPVPATPPGSPAAGSSGTSLASKPDGFSPSITADEWNRLAAKVQGPLVDEPISFRQGQTQLSEEDQSTIRDSLAKLDRFPGSRILVEAHVDPSGSPQDDQKLSDQRASEVKRFLTQDCGLSQNRVLARGFGSDQLPERTTGMSEAEWKRLCRSVRILLVGA